MEPTSLLAAGVAAFAGVLAMLSVLAMAARQLVRLASSVRVPRLLRRPIIALAVVASMLRAAPVAATMPPPILRLDPPPPVTVQATTAAAPVGQAPGTHTVQAGDTLWEIGKSELLRRGEAVSGPTIARMWRAIYAANANVIGSDPDLILPGQQLVMPEAA